MEPRRRRLRAVSPKLPVPYQTLLVVPRNSSWLQHQAADAGKSDSAIAAITEPKISFTVMASGVALVQKERVVSDEAEEHDHSSHEH